MEGKWDSDEAKKHAIEAGYYAVMAGEPRETVRDIEKNLFPPHLRSEYKGLYDLASEAIKEFNPIQKQLVW